MLLRSVFLIVFVCGFWPVWQWYLSRIFDCSDEPWGLLALGTAVGALFFYSNKLALIVSTELAGKIATGLAFISMSAYIISLFCCPHLLQAVMMVMVFWSLIWLYLPQPSGLGIMGLLLLALPAVSSINFFLGYPLRLVISAGAAAILSGVGLRVEREGAMLVLNQQLISVDAPCSGVNMLWAAAYLATVSMCFCRLNWTRSLVLSIFAIIMVIFANILRVSSLSYFTVKAASLYPKFTELEPFVHLSAGITVFLLLGVAITCLAIKLKARSQSDSVRPRQSNLSGPGFRQMIMLAIFSIIAGVVPFFQHSTVSETSAPVIWPEEINGCRIRPNQVARNDSKFAEGFPGQTKQFTDGRNNYVVRWIRSETRQLHPSSDCFKAMGYELEYGPLIEMSNGIRWSSFTAAKDKSRFRVLERIHDEHGRSWTDVSEWYWSACFGKTKGPWWDIVIAQAIE